jgi:glycosyltransferase involved in cell wall biosynthesis
MVLTSNIAHVPNSGHTAATLDGQGRCPATRIRVMQVLEATDGGTGRHVEEAIAALDCDEFELHVVCSTRRSPRFLHAIEAIQRRGHRITVLPLARRPHLLLDPFCIVRLRRVLREWPCDVVYLHSSKAGFLGRLAAGRRSGKIVYAPHAPYFLRCEGPASCPWLFRWAERVFASRVHVMHAVSQAEAAIMTANGIYNDDRILVLENAIDASSLRGLLEPLEPIRPAGGSRVIGFIGELRDQKAPLLFLRSVRKALARGLAARFLLPARGPQLDRCRRYVALHGLSRNIQFVPAESSLNEVYRRIDISVLPSAWEGLPYTLLEAMALERPVIVSDLPVFAQLIGSIEPRLLFPAGDADALADRMIWWAARPATEIETLAKRLYERVRRDHDAGVWRHQLRSFIRGLATQAPTCAAGPVVAAHSPEDRIAS